MVLSGSWFQRFLASAVLVLFGFAVPMQVGAAEAPPIAGTMPEDYLPELKPILAGALKRSPELIVKEFERLVNEARIYGADAPRLPQVGGSFNYASTSSSVSGTNSEQSRGNGFFYSLSASQALFHWNALKNQSAAARLNLLVAERDMARVYRELAVQLRKAYLSLVVEKARVRQVREGYRLAENELAITAEKKERGLVSSAGLEGEKLKLSEQKLELDRVEDEFAKNRLRFARLAGLPPDFPESAIPNDIPKPVYSAPVVSGMTARLLSENGKGTLESETYDLRIREATLQQKIQNTRLLPKFGASAGYTLRNDTTVNGNSVNQRAVAEQTIAVGGYWNIFDGLATRGAKREAAIAKRTLEYRKTVEVDQLLQNAQTLERTLGLDARQLEQSEIRYGLAKQGRDNIRTEVSFGNLPKSDLERAEQGILLAEAKNLESRAAYLGRWSEFVAVAGDDPVLNNLPVRYVREKK
jgi:outer membrane protein TolC